MNQLEMKRRTKEFAKEIIRLCRKLPNSREGRLIGDQIFRSGTSVAANYRSACRGRSKAEFISKLSIVEEEADETLFWLEVITEMKVLKCEKLDELMRENDEILAIVVASIKTAKRSKDPGPEDPALNSPQRGGVYLRLPME
ncbi:hypothetical protein D1AOALGA4SA_13047 [Olavius algarvensis Delta 1 endosymbiont]|nr:hypothetical protein D1AOALGA4SA_13047 [Olavius algarvensis Delta 1 endosymbiont]